MERYQFDYYYHNEADQYSFYRIPKALFTDKIFKPLSCEAKVLYGLLLDRMSLSMKNHWVDEYNRVFIYFTLDEVIETMSCGQSKAVKILAELDIEKGIGLIERKKQGLGKPTIIYVKSFISYNRDKEKPATVQTYDKQQSGLMKNNSQDLRKTTVQSCEKQQYGLVENNGLDLSFPIPIKNDFKDTDINNTQSINPSPAFPESTNAHDVYRQIIYDRIAYDTLYASSLYRETVDEFIDIIMDTLCSTKRYIRVGGENKAADLVKGQLLKIDSDHIDYVLDCLKNNANEISNIRGYILTTLYNSVSTISNYYQNRVLSDNQRLKFSEVKKQNGV